MKKKVVIAVKKPDPKMLKQRKAETKPAKENKRKKNPQPKDPNAPKRPATAFFIFMVEFRNYFKAQFPEINSSAIVVRAGGDKWKSMSDSEKAPYTEKAMKKKVEYEKALQDYKNKKLTMKNQMNL